MYKIAIGCDPNAVGLKEQIVAYLAGLGYEMTDCGGEDHIYANTAFRVGQYVAQGNADRGILLCGTGIGMSIAANKVKGVYAALLTDVYSAERAAKSNNANLACLGAFTVGVRLAEKLLTVWLESSYQAGTSSEPKVERIKEYEECFYKADASMHQST